MESLFRQFNEHPSEQNGFVILNYLRCINAHNLTVLIGQFIINLYPESLNIRSETAISAFYSKQYRLSYDLYSNNLEFPNLDDTCIKQLKNNRNFSAYHITDDYIQYNKELVDKITYRSKRTVPIITFTITSCKRFDLFEKTINSFINCCKDIDRIDHWLCVDDNSSPGDRLLMQELYPFFTFYWKNPNEKGHPRSMNIIRKTVKTVYIFHMEDDWKFFHRRNYISDCIEVLLSNPLIGQCLINKNYSETIDDGIVGGFKETSKRGIKFLVHEYTPDQYSKETFIKKYNNTRNCAYWPHFSFRPSLLKRDVLMTLGPYNEGTSHFEMDYSYRYANKGYKSCFLDGIFCIHTGRLTTQLGNKEIPNAYDLNCETQFYGKEEELKKKKRFSLGANVKTYVVNMDTRVDRMKKFADSSPINFNRFSAVNGNILKPNAQLQRIFEDNDYNMRVGIVGCAMSHIQLYIELVNSDMDMFCILEDDVTFSLTFTEQLKHLLSDLCIPDKWDLIYIGHHLYQKYKTDDYKSNVLPVLEKWDQQTSRNKSMGGTFGYLISKEGAMKLLGFINTTGMTNGIDTVQQKAIGVIDTYYCLPHLVFSECAIPGHPVDSDIQYNKKSLTLTMDLDTQKEYPERLMKDGVFNVEDALKEIKFQYTNDWFVRNIDISMKILKNIFVDKPVKVLEIGTHEGRSAIWMLENLCLLPGSTFTSVDPYCTDDTTSPVNTKTYKLFSHNINLSTQIEKFNQYIDYSYNIMPKLIEEKKVYDIIYLDGSHLTEDVLQDAIYSHQMIQSNGIILFDDAGFDNNCTTAIKPAIKQFLAKYPTEYRVILKEWQWMIQKI
jgi:GR25 family glycosyltransferase involved in LPS biosynthesis/predicted O-methyltransferase YrrM